jgi:hypothetical protein
MNGIAIKAALVIAACAVAASGLAETMDCQFQPTPIEISTSQKI